MFCKKCGAELNDGQQFCTKCGAPTGASEQQPIDLKNMASNAAGQVLNRTKAVAGKNTGLLLTNIVLVFLSIISITFMKYAALLKYSVYFSGEDTIGGNMGYVLFFVLPSILTLVMMILPIFGKVKQRAWHFIPFIVAGFIYLIISFEGLESVLKYKEAHLTFGGWLFYLCTIAAIVISFVLIAFSRKEKRRADLEEMAKAIAKANGQNNNGNVG